MKLFKTELGRLVNDNEENFVVFDGTSVFVTPVNEFDAEMELLEAFESVDEAFDFAERQDELL